MNEKHTDGSEGLWQKRAAQLFIVLALSGAIYLCLGTLFRLLLPFLLAAAIAAMLRPAASWLERHSKFSKSATGIFLLILLLLTFGAALFFLFDLLVSELQRLASHLSESSGTWAAKIKELSEMFSTLSEHIPFLSHLRSEHGLSEFWESVDARLSSMIADALSALGAKIPEWLAALAMGIPDVLLFALTALLSAFYLCADGDGIEHALTSRLSPAWQARWARAKGALSRLGGKYVKAYLLLFLLTFASLFLGFCILRLPYIFLPALLIALFDILPMFGVATVLLPWGAIELLRGNAFWGIGLLILCAVMLILRQILEPRILGSSLGLHPLLTLFAAYAGWQLFGILGMLIGPAIALLVKGLCWDREAAK